MGKHLSTPEDCRNARDILEDLQSWMWSISENHIYPNTDLVAEAQKRLDRVQEILDGVPERW